MCGHEGGLAAFMLTASLLTAILLLWMLRTPVQIVHYTDVISYIQADLTDNIFGWETEKIVPFATR